MASAETQARVEGGASRTALTRSPRAWDNRSSAWQIQTISQNWISVVAFFSAFHSDLSIFLRLLRPHPPPSLLPVTHHAPSTPNLSQQELYSAAKLLITLSFTGVVALLSSPYEIGEDGRGSARPGVFKPYPRALFVVFTAGFATAFCASLMASLVKLGLPERMGKRFLWVAISGLCVPSPCLSWWLCRNHKPPLLSRSCNKKNFFFSLVCVVFNGKISEGAGVSVSSR